MVWEGKQSVVTGRKIVGATNPLQSEPGTVRGDFCIDVGRNLIHGALRSGVPTLLLERALLGGGIVCFEVRACILLLAS
jgi:hypothetical protein